MAKKAVTSADKKASSKPKSNKKDKRAAAIDAAPAIEGRAPSGRPSDPRARLRHLDRREADRTAAI